MPGLPGHLGTLINDSVNNTQNMTDKPPSGKEDIMAFDKKTDSDLSKEMMKSAGDAAVQELDDDMLAEVAGGRNILETGADILSNKKVHRVLNVKGAVFSDQMGRVFGAKKEKGK